TENPPPPASMRWAFCTNKRCADSSTPPRSWQGVLGRTTRSRGYHMPILSFVIYTIGPSIAKAILKLWLKDQAILADVIPDLLDLLKTTAQGERDQQQSALRIEHLGVQIAKRMQPVFDDAGLEVTGRAAVAQELATTLAAARIHPRVLVECNLDP